ncbi:tRNA1(Val) (adenine(37)-N6)-methyltransferase [Pacificibacter marinus]|uniref:N5-glutamine S-adenosyl-L-methionine-dependent methyltransferase n=1 Tax=Pacificibacter marinus TaxID=658057 RepID=A0A1Y5TGP5_9RHOB|nr:methyltransferase [Pacificibacter marinus]SEL18332.1 tRNA1(Val) A37 N6-methylase TrmN6 [Pacificibacter marinus]SLN63645.1 N5-glutamine S-adenosyl-L-methionine-dependent methyltransferase [Pacificibacter marinus]
MTARPETCDAFLMGRVQLHQPERGYRAGVDPVLLAAATPAEQGETVLELGCGAGAASLCLNARVAGLEFVGVELQPYYADLARRNAAENAANMDVVQSDIRNMPLTVRDRRFNHVIANPPYYLKEKSTASVDAGRDVAVSGETPLETWIDIASRRLAPRGVFTMIQKADRLLDILSALEGRLGSVRVRPIQARSGRAARLVVVQARKLGRADFVLEAPLRMHDGPRHERDGDSYSDKALAILRNSAALDWGN